MNKELDYKWLAFRDNLTKVYNRNYYELEFKNNFKQGWIIYLDMDNFKEINDTQGHTAGDKTLISFVNDLKKVFEDKIIRIGGDEFIGYCYSEKCIKDPLVELEKNFKFSYGIVYKKEEDSIEEIIDQAEKLMYKMKSDKKDLQKETKIIKYYS